MKRATKNICLLFLSLSLASCQKKDGPTSYEVGIFRPLFECTLPGAIRLQDSEPNCAFLADQTLVYDKDTSEAFTSSTLSVSSKVRLECRCPLDSESPASDHWYRSDISDPPSGYEVQLLPIENNALENYSLGAYYCVRTNCDGANNIIYQKIIVE